VSWAPDIYKIPERVAGTRILSSTSDANKLIADVYAFRADFALGMDHLSGTYALFITFVGFLIHVYSASYMHDEKPEHYGRYFSYLNLFVFSMLLLVLGVGAVAAVFFLVIKPRLNEVRPAPVVTTPPKPENTNSNTNVAVEAPKTEPEFVAPPNTVKFENSKEALEGKLAEHYFDFSFYYPNEWTVVPKTPSGASFAKVERRLPPDFTQENFAVGWYDGSTGTFAGDEAGFPQRVEDLSARLAKALPEYKKVSEGPIKFNSVDAYEFRFVSLSKGTEKGDLQLWGRVIFLPRGAGETTGATLSMLTTSLAPELSGVDDVGEKGELPIVLKSFRFGKKP